jgi:thymidylate synthase (FAD)
VIIDLYGDEIGCVELIDHMGTDLSVVNAARVSFGNTKAELDEKDEKLIKYLMNHRHTSPFEHCTATFRFVVPLFVRSQHHRHRTWSYNEISRRYTSKDIRFYEPVSFRTQHKSNRQASNVDESVDKKVRYGSMWREVSEAVKLHHQASLQLFNSMLDAGVCREQARGVLPQNMYTEYTGTVDLHNLLHFIMLRTHEGAQWEIQKVAEALQSIAKTLWPVSVQAFEERSWK